MLDNYLIWELCKQKGIQDEILAEASDDDLERKIIAKVREEYREKNYDPDEKMEKLKELDNNPEYRSKVYRDCSWSKEKVKVKKLGTTLPRFGGLPPEVISGTLPEVIEFVRKADPEEYPSVKYIMDLKEAPEVLNEFLPWIITPGNRHSKLERMNRVHGKNDWTITDTWGMINDGNHRAIAKILAEDKEEIKCYVGRQQNRL